MHAQSQNNNIMNKICRVSKGSCSSKRARASSDTSEFDSTVRVFGAKVDIDTNAIIFHSVFSYFTDTF